MNLELNNSFGKDPRKNETMCSCLQRIQAEQDPEIQKKEYLDFLTSFEQFFFREKDPQVLHHTISKSMPMLLSLATLASSSLPALVQTLRILGNSLSIHIKIHQPAQIAIFFKATILAAISSLDILTIADPFFSSIFADESFYLEFSKSGAFLDSWSFIFSNLDENYSIAEWAINMMIKPIPGSIIQTIFPQIFPSFSVELDSIFHSQNGKQLSQSKLEKKISLYNLKANTLISIFVKFSKIDKTATQFLISSKFLDGLELLLNKHPTHEWIPFFATLINAYDYDNVTGNLHPPNFHIIQWSVKLSASKTEIHQELFEIFHPYFTNARLNDVFPIRKWFSSFNQPLPILTLLIEELNEKTPKIIPECLPELFNDISSFYSSSKNDQTSPDDKPLIQTLDVLKSQLNNHILDLVYLLKSGFLKAFIFSLPSSVMQDLMIHTQNYFDIVIDVFKLKETGIDFQHAIFKNFLKASLQFSKTTSFFIWVTELLSAAPQSNNLHILLKSITKSKDILVCNSLLSLFTKNEDIEKSFIEAKGLQWLNDSLSSGLLSMDLFASILASLSVMRHFDEVDDFIISLPKDHPLFSLPDDQIDKIVYGLNRSSHRPIRVYSLFYKLPSPNYIDPYNSYLLGKYVVDQYISRGTNIYEIPFIVPIVNRFVHPCHVDLLLERPFELEPFCDLSYDHFPVFQFYQGNQDFSCTAPYKAISFWFRTSANIKLSSTFFRCDIVQLSLIKDSLTVLIENFPSSKTNNKSQIISKNVLTIDSTKWNHIMISQVESFRSIEIIVSVNKKEIKQQVPLQNLFSFASFRSVGQDLLFLGASIRFYRKEAPSASQVFSKGPSNIEELSSVREEHIVTPYALDEENQYLSVPINLVSVPYFGLPFHFISVKRLSTLVSKLEAAPTEKEFQSMFSALLHINQVTSKNSVRFFPTLLSTIKKCKKFLSKSLFFNAIESVSKSTQQQAESILSSLLFDSEMWEMVSNEILVPVLFEYFQNVKWQSIEDFELFLATVVLRNPHGKMIIETILQNSKKVPNTVSYVVSLIGTAHALDKTFHSALDWDSYILNKETCHEHTIVEHTIIDGFIQYINQTNDINKVKHWFPFERIRSLLSITQGLFASKILHLAFLIGDIEVNEGLLIIIAQLAEFPIIWHDVIQFYSKKNQRKNSLPLLVSLIWAISIASVHSVVFNNHSPDKPNICKNLEAVNFFYGQAVKICCQEIPEILKSTLCLTILESFFPLIVSSINLLRKDVNDTSEQLDPADKLSAADISDADLPLWSGSEQVVATVKIPPPNPPLMSIDFMIDLIAKILRNFSKNPKEILPYQFDKNNTTSDPSFPINYDEYSKEPDVEALEGIVLQSPVFIFMTEILLVAPTPLFKLLMPSFFLSLPFYDKEIANHVVPPLLHLLFQEFKIKVSEGPKSVNFLTNLIFFLQYVHLFVGIKIFKDNNHSCIFLSDFLDFFSMLSNSTSAVHYSFQHILIGFFHINIPNLRSTDFQNFDLSASSSTSSFIKLAKTEEDEEELINILSKYPECLAQAVNTSKTQYAWAFFLDYFAKKNFNRFPTFATHFIGIMKLTPPDRLILARGATGKLDEEMSTSKLVHQFWKNQIDTFLKTSTALFAEVASPHSPFKRDLRRISSTVSEEEYSANCKHFLEANLFSNSVKFLDSTFSLIEERMQWTLFISSIDAQMTDVTQFNPVSYQLSSRYCPFKPPTLFTPSWFPTAQVLDMFNNNSKTIFKSLFENSKILKCMHGDLTFLSLFLKIINKGEPIETANINLNRRGISIPSVLFIFDSTLMILTFASIEPRDLKFLPMEQSAEVTSFLEDVFLGHWGSTYIFASHLIIKVPIASLIHIRQYTPLSYAFWSFKNGHFLIQFIFQASGEKQSDNHSIDILQLSSKDQKTLQRYSTLLERFSSSVSSTLPPLPFLFKFKTPSSALSALRSNQITVNEFLLLCNGLDGRSFIDPKNYPAFPDLHSVSSSTTPLLQSYVLPEVPADFYSTPEIFSHKYSQEDLFINLISESPDEISPHKRKGAWSFKHRPKNTDFPFEKMRGYLASFVAKSGVEETIPFWRVAQSRSFLERFDAISWASLHLDFPSSRRNSFDDNGSSFRRSLGLSDLDAFHVGQRLCSRVRRSQALVFDGNGISKVRRLSARIEPSPLHFISIDKANLLLTILERNLRKVIFSLLDDYMAFASSLSVSQNGLLLTVDFEFGLTRCYRIIYKNEAPYEVVQISDFSWSGKPITLVSGSHWMCATARTKHVVLWEAFTGTVHRDLIFDGQIKAIALDDSTGILWIAEGNKLKAISVNGDVMAEEEIDICPCYMAAVQKSSRDLTRRCCVIGGKDGELEIAVIRIDVGKIDRQKMPSLHKAPVRAVVVHQSGTAFVSVDEEGNADLWGIISSGPSFVNLKPQLFAKCPMCGRKPEIMCPKCHRAVCPLCVVPDTSMCQMCSALSVYF